MMPLLRDIFVRMLEASWQAALIAAVVLIVQSLLSRRLAPRWRCALWAVVFVRLVMPALPPSPMSLANLRPASAIDPPAEMIIRYGVIPQDFSPRIEPLPVGELAAARSTVDGIITTAITLWLTIAGGLIGIRFVGAVRFGRRLRSSPHAHDPRLLAILADTARRIGVAPPPIIETDLVSAPALAGVFTPRLLLPRGFADRLSPGEIEFVLLHELAHLRRRDVLVGWMTWLITAMHWFNPIVWLAAARFRAEREIACDAMVLGKSALAARTNYGRTILRVLELFPAPPPRVSAAVGMLSGRRTIRRRIAAISAPLRSWPVLGPIVFIALGCGMLTGPRESSRPSASSAPSSAAATAAEDPPGTEMRAYDVRDLLLEIPNFDNAPQLGVPTFPPPRPTEATSRLAEPTPRPAEPTSRLEPIAHSTEPTLGPDDVKTRAQAVNDLIVRITSTIDPLSWRSNTGKLGSIREARGQLLVTQTPQNHERVQRMLQQMRGGRALQVTVETRILSASPSADKVLKRWGETWTPVEGCDYQMCPRFLEEKDVRELLRAVQADKNSSLITAPRITLFNGQRAYVLVSRQTAYVADFKRLADAEGDKSVEPVIGIIASGVLVDCRAQVSPDHQFATLTLAPQLATLEELVPQRWPGSTPGHERVIQVPHVRKATLATTVTMPDGKSVLYRRPQTVQVEVKPGVIKSMEQSMLLLVKPMIVHQREQPTAPLSGHAWSPAT